MTTLFQLRKAINSWAEELGFQQLGVTDVDLTEHEPHVRAWLHNGFQGSMGYLKRNLEKRLHPEQLETNTCRVIAVRMNYLPDDSRPIEVLNDKDRGYVSRYALGRDYHKVVRGRLAKLARRIDSAASEVGANYRAFTDSAPVLEKALAEKAGLGWIGKHTLLLNRSAGSWFFLGEIYTNLPLPIDEPHATDHCGNCKACITVCPTGAIIGPKQLDARRCISYLT
ncbi:MAG: tRNA epoxyqueuosine(34) reductase QueG, partial [Gammaproteobacteria bacterium]|nr:tRNA epoxyqueuosine(34) reductase QueG [Gammaproteobacteria bacterium]